MKNNSYERKKAIVSAIATPLTYEKIAERTGLEKKEIVYVMNWHLKRTGTAKSIKLNINSTGHKRTFYSIDLLGQLSNKTVAYLTGNEKQLGEFILENLPKNLSDDMKKSLKMKLRNVIPQESFEVIKEYL